MNIRLVVDVELNFISGKFASRDDIVRELQEQISDPGSLSVNEGEYEVANFSVDELPEGHCDSEIRLAVGKLLATLAADKRFKNYDQHARKLHKLLGAP